MSACRIESCDKQISITALQLCGTHYYRHTHGLPEDGIPKLKKICEYCDTEFIATQQKHKRRYCSRECYKADRLHAKCKCQHCGKMYRPKRNDRLTYCSRECYFKELKANVRYLVKPAYNPIYQLTCEVCGKEFIHKNSAIKTCSNKCKKKRNAKISMKQYRKSNPLEVVECKECGKVFEQEVQANQSYCSRKCGHKQIGRITKAKRKARLRSLPYENIDPIVIFERDNWVCQLCGDRTLKSKRGTCHDRAPELDHIVPISKGGHHIESNVQCSCRKCNYTKGGQILGQLRLAV